MLHVRLSLLLLSEPSEMPASVCMCARACYVLLHFYLNKHLYLRLAVVLIIFGEV